MSKYNGWSNYATWRINLEFFNGCQGRDLDSKWERLSLEEQVQVAAEELNDFVRENTSNSWVRAWVEVFLADVNFYEIVQHIEEEALASEITAPMEQKLSPEQRGQLRELFVEALDLQYDATNLLIVGDSSGYDKKRDELVVVRMKFDSLVKSL